MTWWTWPGLRGSVLEQIPGRLIDIGAGGCSLETSTRLTSGTYGFVEVQGADAALTEAARVCDVTERPGAAAPFLVRLEFLPIPMPAHARATDRALRSPAGSLAAAGEKAGSHLTLVPRRTGNGDGHDTDSVRPASDPHDCAEADSPGKPLADHLKK